MFLQKLCSVGYLFLRRDSGNKAWRYDLREWLTGISLKHEKDTFPQLTSQEAFHAAF